MSVLVGVVYARVSSEDQARTGFSLPSQLEAGCRHARELGIGEAVPFADEGVPGDLLERPGLQAALEAVRRGGVSHFICYDPDRLARSLSLQLLVTDQIERAGTRLEFVNFDYKNTPEGQLFYSLRGAISQYEKAKIRERTMRGKRQKARAGGLTHNPCIYGYHFDPATDTLSVNEAEAQTVQMIFHWFLQEDIGPWTIAQRLTDLGIRPARGGEAWHHSSVRSILRNQSYTGAYHQQKWDYADTRLNKYRPAGEKVKRKVRPQAEWVSIPIPAIISEETHRAALARLENARRWWSGRHKEEYLLSGLCRCLLCGRPIHGASRQSGKSRLRYYVCRGYAPGVPGEPRCRAGRVRADAIEAGVWERVEQLIGAEGHLERLLDQPSGEKQHDREHELLRRQIRQAEAEHERTARLAVRGALDQDLSETLLQEQRQRLQRLKGMASRAEAEALGRAEEAMPIQAACDPRERLSAHIHDLPFPLRQMTIRALVKVVEISGEEVILKVRLTSLTAQGTEPGAAPEGCARG